MILVIKRRNILASTLFCFHQIFKQGQNIKIEIWKCPIKVELVKKSSYRAGTLQMPFEIYSNLCEVYIFINKVVLSKKKHLTFTLKYANQVQVLFFALFINVTINRHGNRSLSFFPKSHIFLIMYNTCCYK